MTVRKTLGLRLVGTDAPLDPGAWAATGDRLERLKEHARAIRRNPTDAQLRLWNRLDGSRLGGFKFRRQQVVGTAIVNFACSARWLVVDINGDSANAEVDSLRDRKLASAGIRVLRFTEHQVMEEIDSVCDAILAELQQPFDRKAAMRANA